MMQFSMHNWASPLQLHTLIIGAFTWLSFGIWNGVLGAFSVPLFESVSSNRAFTNHVSRLRLKVNSITRTEFSAWKWAWLFYEVSRLSKCHGNLSIAYMQGSLHGKQTVQFSVLRLARCWEGTTPMRPKLIFCLFAWWRLMFLSTSHRNRTNIPFMVWWPELLLD